MLESARLPGAKIVISGGGRCNVTNAIVTERDFWGGKRSVIRRVLRAFSVEETIDFFEGLGVALKEEPGGKMFPVSDRSRDVSQALLRELERCGAQPPDRSPDHRCRASTRTPFNSNPLPGP